MLLSIEVAEGLGKDLEVSVCDGQDLLGMEVEYLLGPDVESQPLYNLQTMTQTFHGFTGLVLLEQFHPPFQWEVHAFLFRVKTCTDPRYLTAPSRIELPRLSIVQLSKRHQHLQELLLEGLELVIVVLCIFYDVEMDVVAHGGQALVDYRVFPDNGSQVLRDVALRFENIEGFENIFS